MTRYLPIPEPEHDDDLGPDDGYYCSDCPTHPFVAIEDLDAHDRLHVERAAAADPNQGALL